MEDARAALDLALLKIERGPSYGVASGEAGDKLAEVLTQHDRCTRVGSVLYVMHSPMETLCGREERRGGCCGLLESLLKKRAWNKLAEVLTQHDRCAPVGLCYSAWQV